MLGLGNKKEKKTKEEEIEEKKESKKENTVEEKQIKKNSIMDDFLSASKNPPQSGDLVEGPVIAIEPDFENFLIFTRI